MNFKLHRSYFFFIFLILTIFLFTLKLLYPQLVTTFSTTHKNNTTYSSDSIIAHSLYVDSLFMKPRKVFKGVDANGRPLHNKIISVPDFDTAFPDLNDVQLLTAKRLGLQKPISNRQEAQQKIGKLVYIGNNPYYKVEHLHQSIPYLVPRAAVLLEEIARSFMDSCIAKGIGKHKIVITSVTRTQEDVEKLRRFNHNASENSCHMYGTTFDIGYNKYERVQDSDGIQRPTEWGTKLKSILAEVLNDQRQLGTCYIKYEYRKPCFHITCR